MADPITGAIVVAFLTPYLVKTTEKLAERAGDALADKIGQIYSTVKDKFKEDEYAGLTLLRLEDTPDNEGRKSSLEHIIQEKMDEDESFKSRLTQLVNEAKELNSNGFVVIGNRNISVAGDVTSSILNTGDSSKNQ